MKFDSPQVKWNVISSIRNFFYELYHKLSEDLSLRILGNKEILGKSQYCLRTQPSLQSPVSNFGTGAEKQAKTAIKVVKLFYFLIFSQNILHTIVEKFRQWYTDFEDMEFVCPNSITVAELTL